MQNGNLWRLKKYSLIKKTQYIWQFDEFQESVAINGTFDVYEAYTAMMIVYENERKIKSTFQNSIQSIPQPSPAEGTTFGALLIYFIIKLSLMSGLFVALQKHMAFKPLRGTPNGSLWRMGNSLWDYTDS